MVNNGFSCTSFGLALVSIVSLGAAVLAGSATAQDKPNIVVIWGDDIGITNISAYSDGIMGYETPNIDRIANEGIRFIDYYGEQSCTAGRAAFLTGQSVFRTGNSKVGLPGAKQGLNFEDPTIAELLKPHGYATAQFGKNHLGDRNEFLPTVHGFDEFFGVLYHLNAMQDIFSYDYPGGDFLETQGPRGVIDSAASDTDDPTEQDRWGKIGKQTILSDQMWEEKDIAYFDDKVADRSLDFMERQVAANKPFFLWTSFTHMHLWTYTKKESLHQSGLGGSPYHDSMIDHDKNVGEILDKIDELGIADNTIVLYSTDNGVHMNTHPDGGMTPFRGEKNTNWEGGFRVPAVARWPGKIEPGQITNQIVSHLDWIPTLMAAVGEPDITDKLKAGHQAGEKTYKVHLDGYNMLPMLTGDTDKSPREEFFYFSDDGNLLSIRHNAWKVAFSVQDLPGTFEVWQNPFRTLRLPYIFNLRTDPFERQPITGNNYNNWLINHTWGLVPVQGITGEFLASFQDFPPRAKAASFTVDQALEALQESHGG